MKRAFTLVELLVVIAIIGILASIVTVSLSSSQVRARDTKRISELTQLAKLIKIYIVATGNVPADIAGCDTSYGGGNPCPTPGSGWNSSAGLSSSLVPAYTPSLPIDPVNNSSYNYAYEPSAYGACLYAESLERSPGTRYIIRIAGPNATSSSSYDAPCNGASVDVSM